MNYSNHNLLISTGDQNESVADDSHSRQQWELINNHLKQMHLWTDEIPSPLSTSPSNKNSDSVISRGLGNQHNPLYRRSEGDIQVSTFEHRKASNPPQSAPVVSEGYVLKWDNQSPSNPLIEILPELVEPSPTNSPNHDLPEFVLNDSNSIEPVYTKVGKKERSKSDFSGNINFQLTSPNCNDNSVNVVAGPKNMTLIHSSVSSPSLQFQQNNLSSVCHHQYFQNSTNLLSHEAVALSYMNSPFSRRQSAPIASRHYTKNPFHSVSQSYLGGDCVIQQLATSLVKETSASNTNDIDDDDDDEDADYRRALLLHQKDRMDRLSLEFEAKKSELNLLYSQIKAMELQAMQNNSANKTLASSALQLDIGRLREINRKLKIDCNCMYKEVELFSSYGDNTSENFYSRYNRASVKSKSKRDAGNSKPRYNLNDLPPPPLPPPAEAPDEPKWRCKHCTFDNHAALNKCEMCDYPRAVAT